VLRSEQSAFASVHSRRYRHHSAAAAVAPSQQEHKHSDCESRIQTSGARKLVARVLGALGQVGGCVGAGEPVG